MQGGCMPPPRFMLKVLAQAVTLEPLGAIAMPKGVFGALMEVASPGRYDIHLVHAEEDALCNVAIPPHQG